MARQHKIIEFNGESKTITEWAAVAGMDRDTLSSRLARGWAMSRALEQPFNKSRGKRFRYKGSLLTLREWAEFYDLRVDLVRNRLRRGWSLDKALTTPVLAQKRTCNPNNSVSPQPSAIDIEYG